MTWGTPIEKERHRRIMVLLWAYAYEFESDSLVDDHTFDRTCYEIRPHISTGHPVMDKFFKEQFDPCTGQWVHSVPEAEMIKLKALYKRVKGLKK